MTDTTPLLDDDLERMAQRRARAKLGWYTHASVYTLVNLFLWFLSSRSSQAWAVYPALGWGLGLFMHFASVWVRAPAGGLRARLLARERAALQREQRT